MPLLFSVLQSGLLDREGIESAKKILNIARKGGINLFDNAETYVSDWKIGNRAEILLQNTSRLLRETHEVKRSVFLDKLTRS